MIEKRFIKMAKKVDLASYLISKGISLKKNGTRYRSVEHDSLVITKNLYVWNSRGEKGDTLDYVVRYVINNFKEAVKDLCQFDGASVEMSRQEESFFIDKVEFTKDMKRSIAYLNKARGLNIDIIQFFISLGVIKQTADKNNIAFLMLDKHCEIVGIEYNTTLSDKRFKGIEKGSKYGYGFNIRNTNEPENAFFFESAIDMLSFAQCVRLEKTIDLMNNSIFISMAGLKENVLNKTIELYKPKKIFLAVDNDVAGKNFVQDIKEKYKSFDIKYIFPKKCKDWNDLYRRA